MLTLKSQAAATPRLSHRDRPPRHPRRDVRGFTLIELMIGVAIACILASIAFPSYQAIVARSRRFDAQAALLQLQGTEERYRAANAQYGSLDDLHAASTSPSGFYAVRITGVSSSSYELLASAVGTQQVDAVCRNLKVAVAGDSITYASGTDSATTNSETDNKRCWGV